MSVCLADTHVGDLLSQVSVIALYMYYVIYYVSIDDKGTWLDMSMEFIYLSLTYYSEYEKDSRLEAIVFPDKVSFEIRDWDLIGWIKSWF